jgi:hypothetical protein
MPFRSLLVPALAALLAAGPFPPAPRAFADGPPAVPPLAFRALAPRLATLTDPLVLQVRHEADGRFGLRVAVPAERPAWTAFGSWRLDGTTNE